SCHTGLDRVRPAAAGAIIPPPNAAAEPNRRTRSGRGPRSGGAHILPACSRAQPSPTSTLTERFGVAASDREAVGPAAPLLPPRSDLARSSGRGPGRQRFRRRLAGRAMSCVWYVHEARRRPSDGELADRIDG